MKALILGVTTFLSTEGEGDSKIEKAVQTFKQFYSSQPDQQAALTNSFRETLLKFKGAIEDAVQKKIQNQSDQKNQAIKRAKEEL